MVTYIRSLWETQIDPATHWFKVIKKWSSCTT